MLEQRVRLGEGGRIIIPAPYRQALGIKPGDELVMHLESGELRLIPRSEALKRLRAAARATQTPLEESHTDGFLAFRKRDSE